MSRRTQEAEETPLQRVDAFNRAFVRHGVADIGSYRQRILPKEKEKPGAAFPTLLQRESTMRMFEAVKNLQPMAVRMEAAYGAIRLPTFALDDYGETLVDRLIEAYERKIGSCTYQEAELANDRAAEIVAIFATYGGPLGLKYKGYTSGKTPFEAICAPRLHYSTGRFQHGVTKRLIVPKKEVFQMFTARDLLVASTGARDAGRELLNDLFYAGASEVGEYDRNGGRTALLGSKPPRRIMKNPPITPATST
jgi:hypothetical protein